MKVALEPFARTCIESVFGQDLPAGTEAAVRYYASRLESERRPELVPTFLAPTFLTDEETEAHSDADLEFEVSVPAEVEATLAAEARRNEVPVGRIVDHAVFVYAADLDAAGGVKAKEAKTSPRYRVYAHPRLQAATARLTPLGAARARGCDAARGGAGSGAS